jgi:hypothetical protein
MTTVFPASPTVDRLVFRPGVSSTTPRIALPASVVVTSSRACRKADRGPKHR